LRGLLQIVREGGPEGGEERGVRAVPHEEREWFHCHGCFCLLIAAAAASGVASCVYVEGGERGGKSPRGEREIYIAKAAARERRRMANKMETCECWEEGGGH